MNLTRYYPSLGPGTYRRVWAGVVPYHLAFQVGIVATGTAAVGLSSSALDVGLVVGAWGLPILFLPPFGGVAADRYSRRRTMLLSQVALGTSALVIGALELAGALASWHLVMLGLLQGTVYAFFAPARTAYTARAVVAPLVPNAIAAYSLSEHVAAIAGPAVGGLLLATIDVALGWVFVIIAATHAVVWLVFEGLPEQATSPAVTGADRVFDRIREGIVYARGVPSLRVVLTLSAAAMLLGMPFRQLMPIFAEQVHHAGAAGLGTLLAAAGIGAILGSISVSQVRSGGWLSRLPGILGALLGLAALAFALAPSYLVAIGLAAVAGGVAAAFTTLNSAVVASSPNPAFYGRAASLYQLTFALGPLGAIPIAALADRIGAPQAVAAGGVLLALLSPLIVRQLGRDTSSTNAGDRT